jgi:hypothetical protein
VPAKAGPFDLGTVVVRASIRVDPHTAQVTVVSDPFPTILDGIPLDVRDIRVYIDRPEFTFNPTNCEPMSILGTITGALPDGSPGATASVSSRFQVADCASLGFKPKFSASTSAKTSRTNGASLHVSLLYPKAPFGTQANIAKVHVELPKALPSRLSTLNHACLDSVFNQNPASCPAQSRVGYAKAVTPVLPVPLEGPAYFVSHGGQKFPELIIVLQGYGVTVYLEGETFINKAGITSSTFKAVPDVPVGSFELNLPEGANSALAANGDLCSKALYLPVDFTAQNGATLKEKPRISVAGCKPRIRVLRHSVRGNVASIVAKVPSAGKLVVTGKGLSMVVRRVKQAKVVTVTLKVTSAEQHLLAKHPGRRLRVPVKLLFTTAQGAKVKGSVMVLIG